MSRKFIKTKEDFVCEKCKTEVKGSGYTNHCPKCLWSKHVDKNPGDRLEGCGGMMEPVRTEKEGKSDMIVHRCVLCGFERRNRLGAEDDFGAYVAVSRKIAARFSQERI